ncbi:MAG: glycoside hydrolase family 1 protein [Candidatus Omnitrophota bacterium]
MSPFLPTASPLPKLWGSATAAHQVEGNNRNNDWWGWETEGGVKHHSGAACDHWNRFHEDFDLIQKLGHSAYRFSIEWSRLEPREGEWDEAAASRYGEMLADLRRRGIEPIVTLHHFTNPVWFARKGGWLAETAVDDFTAFVRRAVLRFGREVRVWITINEPVVYLSHAYYLGVWPPGHKSIDEMARVFRTMILAHVRAYRAIHEIYEIQGWGPVWVSVAKHMTYMVPSRRGSLADRFVTRLRHWFFNELFLQAVWTGFLFFPGRFCEFLPHRGALDFIGLNYYMRHRIRMVEWSQMRQFGEISLDEPPEPGVMKNVLGWEFFPKGLYKLLKKLKRMKLPIVITENGTCTETDAERELYIRGHLEWVERAMREGVPVGGYLYWSLLDNFEWDKGFGPRFGIVEIDFETLGRKLRPSAYVLSDLCRKLFHGNFTWPPGRSF